MSLLPLLLANPQSTLTSHLDNCKHALSNLVSSIEHDGILLSIDIEDFGPSEVTVTIVNNKIIVEGKHEDKVDTSKSRHFIRKYTLPKSINIENLTTSSSDGLFTIYAPSSLKSTELTRTDSIERVSPIEEATEAVETITNIYKPTERIIPIQLADEIIKLSTKEVACRSVEQMVLLKQKRRILRFENIPESKEDIHTEEKRKLYCCCQ